MINIYKKEPISGVITKERDLMAIKFIIERRKKKWATIKDFPTLFPSSIDLDI
jgi:hypothetical protein